MLSSHGIANNIGPDISKMLAGISQINNPQVLQQIAMQHQDNAMILSAAKYRADELKKLQSGMQQPQGPMPPVKDQVIASMAPQPELPPVQQGPLPQGQQNQQAMNKLPEESGIATLPTPNMQKMAGGGIVAFGDGGDVEPPHTAGGLDGMAAGGEFNFSAQPPTHGIGFNDGGLTKQQGFATKYREAAEYAGKELGVDPGIIIAMWGHETGWGKGVTGKNNLGNIKAPKGQGTVGYDKIEKSNDSYRNYDTPIDFAKDFVGTVKSKFPDVVGAGGDSRKFIAGLHAGEEGGYATDKGYNSKLSNIIASAHKWMPVGTAQAEELPDSDTTVAPAPAKQATGWDLIKNQGKGIVALADTAYNALPGLVGNAVYAGRRVFGSADDAAKAQEYVTRNFSNPFGKAMGIDQDPAYQAEASQRLTKFISENADKGAEWISGKTGVPASDVSNMMQSLAIAAPKVASRLPTPKAITRGTDSGLEALAKAKEAKVENLRLTGPTPEAPLPTKPIIADAEGNAALVAPSEAELAAQGQAKLAAKAAAEKRGLAGLEEDKAAAAKARSEADAATEPSGLDLNKGYQDAYAAASRRGNAGSAGVSAALNGTSLPAALASTPSASATSNSGFGGAGTDKAVMGLSPDVAAEAIDAAKNTAAAKEAESKGFSLSNQDLVMMGLGIMGGKSQYAMENIGQGGLQGLAASRAQKLADAKAEYERKLGDKAEAYAKDQSTKETSREQRSHDELQYKILTAQLASIDKQIASRMGADEKTLDEAAYRQKVAERAQIVQRLDTLNARLGGVTGGTVAPAPQMDFSGWGNPVPKKQ